MPAVAFDETTGQHSGETMRILHLIKHCQPSNGNVNVAIDLACGQARKGHRVVYASAGGHYDTLLDAHGVRRAEIRQGQDNNSFALAGNLAALVRLCRSFEPDVIHAHMMSSAVFGYLASKLTGVPLVTTVHNSFDRHAVLMRAGRRRGQQGRTGFSCWAGVQARPGCGYSQWAQWFASRKFWNSGWRGACHAFDCHRLRFAPAEGRS